MLSISTAFNIHKHKNWNELLDDIKNLGFDSVELNVEVPEKWIKEIESSVNKKQILISSVHNYCPKLENLPANRTIFSGYSLTSQDEQERELAVKYTLKTIDLAKNLNAKAVVIHAGEVPTEPTPREFFNYIQQFGIQGKLFENYKNLILDDRKKKADFYLNILISTLNRCLEFAYKNNITLCLENRFLPNEIPNIEESLFILDKFKGGPIAYWHDTGHAEFFVKLGLANNHTDFLEPLHSKMFGLHLHDIRNLSDHFAPGSGEFDFQILKPYIKDNHIKVIEAHSKSTKKEVSKSIQYLRSIGLD